MPGACRPAARRAHVCARVPPPFKLLKQPPAPCQAQSPGPGRSCSTCDAPQWVAAFGTHAGGGVAQGRTAGAGGGRVSVHGRNSSGRSGLQAAVCNACSKWAGTAEGAAVVVLVQPAAKQSTPVGRPSSTSFLSSPTPWQHGPSALHPVAGGVRTQREGTNWLWRHMPWHAMVNAICSK